MEKPNRVSIDFQVYSHIHPHFILHPSSSPLLEQIKYKLINQIPLLLQSKAKQSKLKLANSSPLRSKNQGSVKTPPKASYFAEQKQAFVHPHPFQSKVSQVLKGSSTQPLPSRFAIIASIQTNRPGHSHQKPFHTAVHSSTGPGQATTAHRVGHDPTTPLLTDSKPLEPVI